MSNIELLAPAGGMEALYAAVDAGADAVYLGGSAFSARQSAKNFTDAELQQAVDYCHLRNVKVFAAVNTLVNDRELQEMEQYIGFLSQIGIDAVIVQDLGVAGLIKRIAPDMPLHGSTQMTVYDTDGALLLQSMGFKRVVLARELSREQIEKICRETDIEIEVFVHGAICVSYSGQCLMSSFIGGRSGNRGKCAQPCRLQYTMGNKSGYLLSPKDMCLIHHLKDLEAIGVRSLKIEGRMKSGDYVGTVTSIYRKYLDSGESVPPEDYHKLENIFYRGGFTDRYYTGKKDGSMLCPTKPDNPYLKQTETEIPLYRRQRPVTIDCRIENGKPLFLRMTDHTGHTADYTGTVPAETAINKPLTEERARQQLCKLGGTVFTAKACTITIDDTTILPISELNSARRACIAKLEQEILQSYRREASSSATFIRPKGKQYDFQLAAQVSTKEQLDALHSAGCEVVYAPLPIAQPQDIAVLPRISPDNLREQLMQTGCKQALARNLGQVKLLRDLQIDCYADYTLNLFNSEAVNWIAQLGAKRAAVSCELMLSQIRDIRSDIPLEAVIYGRIPLMLTENCLVKSSVGCTKGNMLQDRVGEQFPVRCIEGCRNEILNSKPIVLSDKLHEIRPVLAVGRLLFTMESPSECLDIYRAYQAGEKLPLDFTRGKFYKGV